MATADTEQEWLLRAQRLEMRTLERVVARAEGTEASTERPATSQWVSPEVVEVRLRLPAAAWALVQRAMESARQRAERALSDAEALEAVARDALSRPNEAADSGELRRAVVLYECRYCGRTELETGRGAVELSPSEAAGLGCGAKVYDLQTEGRTVSRGGPIPAAIRRAVLLRDRHRCQVPGCGRRRYVDVHHIEPQGQGGVHSRSNGVTVCTTCHPAIHDGKLRVEGDAEGELRWTDEHGQELRADGPSDVVSADRHAGESSIADHGASSQDRAPIGASSPLSANQAKVLAVMGRRGGWQTDRLCEQTRLDVSQLLVALTELELQGQIRRDPMGWQGLT